MWGVSMPYMIENSMVVDEHWDEVEYGVPSKARMRREKQTLDEIEIGPTEEDYAREDY